jgi:hypothetical protein
MSGTTNVPSPAFGATGFVAPAETAILTGVQADINDAFGGVLSASLSTPQGQIAQTETAIIGDQNAQFVYIATQVDPSYAQGRMQDAIGRIYFMTRIAATSTVVQVVCSGLAQVNISQGALIQDNQGNLYASTAAAIIPSSGSITVPFACVNTGPIVCGAQTFIIYQTIFGWDSAVSTTAGVIGNLVESRAAFEARRVACVASNAISTNGAILGAVLSVAGVIDAYVIDNPTTSPVSVGGITLAAYSLYVGVAGGLPTAVAAAIWSKKPPGIPYWSGANTSILVTDPNPLYGAFAPSYTVSYEMPPLVPVYFAVTLKNSTLIPSNALQSVQTAIINAFIGGDAGNAARMGSIIYASRYIADIMALGSWVNIISVQIGLSAVSFTGTIAGSVLTASSVTGTFIVGQFIYGVGISSGTYITSFGTGSGGAGTYNLSGSSAIATGEAMNAITPVNSVTMNINQQPVTSNLNITLVLQ